ncbi:uncharacterized protein LOC130978140 [Arachis stenosperma]|uniref:uncharacterized protein LOC130978140 n=1 Tax=Arachis stenosperma TaxID=217475 RepID=UPI0025AB97AB|nr:uncharacterized protein LOC130978140 [Arachis stenosperma]
MLEPTKNSWSGKGVSIVSDGWSDPQRRPLLNFMAVTESGPMFLKAVDCSEEIKDKDYVAKQIRDVIREVGLSNVVQIGTDNAPVCKAAGLLIEAKFSSVFWTPCVVHTLNLALKDICAAKNTKKKNFVYQECSWITQIAEDASFIKNFIVNHHMRYYSHQWLREDPTRVSPHQDIEITNEGVKCLKRGIVDAKSSWLIHGGKAKFLQPIALRLLGQPSSSSCCERNWSTYSFIHSLKRNKLKLKRAENLVFVHTNLRLLSRKTQQYNKGETMMWDIAGDAFSPIDEENGVLEVAHLSLDEPELERMTFSNDEDINHI